MRILCGAGLRGLRGIHVRRRDGVIRPMLCATRVEIEQYARSHGVAFRTDKSNFDLRFLRNRVRREVLPALRKAGFNADQHLLDLAQEASAQWTRLEPQLDSLAERTVSEEGGQGHIGVELKTGAPPSGCFLREVAGRRVERVSRKHVEALKALAVGQSGKQVKLPNGITAWKTAGKLLLGRAAEERAFAECSCSLGQRARLAECFANSELIEGLPRAFPAASAPEAYFDADRIGTQWRFRPWKAGDRIRPLGMKGEKKISDLLTERKVPLPFRKSVLLMETPRGVAWVVGHRISEDFKVTPETRRSVRVYLDKLGLQAAQENE
jgi:tRNA(Ile)-lysidine synthase